MKPGKPGKPGLKSTPVVIIGGGYSGSCLAVQMVRQTKRRLAITVVESRPQIGPGLAYSTQDPDHRLNAPQFSHTIHPTDAWHFARWCRDERVLEEDLEARLPDGTAFVRRYQFGRYLSAMVRKHSSWPATGSSITHAHDKAVHAEWQAGRWRIELDSGDSTTANLMCLATGNPELRLPERLAQSRDVSPGLIDNPFAAGAMDSLRPAERVLIIGSGLTALDTISTMIRRGHAGPIDSVSRHGLRPAPQGPIPDGLQKALASSSLEAMPDSLLLDRVLAPVPAFLEPPPDGVLTSQLRHWLVALRNRMADTASAGGSWQTGFDELRDVVWQLWPTLPVDERRRFIRHLKPWYDSHRYRSPPQNESLVRSAERDGRIRFLRGTLSTRGQLDGPDLPGTNVAQVYDRVINCAGLDPASGLRSNPLLSSLQAQGWVRADPCGLGIETDLAGRAVNSLGFPLDHLRLVGPPTLGTFGDPIGAAYIAVQVHRLLPHILNGLA